MKNEYRISNKECRIIKYFSFDIRYSLFDILRFAFVIHLTPWILESLNPLEFGLTRIHN